MCPCGTGTAYAACCGRFHTGTRRPPTALALMRSRYSAFALGLPDYLIDTWHPATRPADLTWDADTHWQALEILATTDGRAWQEEGTVTFAARPGPNLMTIAGTLPSSVVDGDIVQINGERDAAQNVVWRRVTAGTPKSFVAIRGASAAVNLSTSVTQVAKAASISVSFTRTGARAPSGVWDGLEPSADALCNYFSAMPASDAQARTLPLIIDDISISGDFEIVP